MILTSIDNTIADDSDDGTRRMVVLNGESQHLKTLQQQFLSKVGKRTQDSVLSWTLEREARENEFDLLASIYITSDHFLESSAPGGFELVFGRMAVKEPGDHFGDTLSRWAPVNPLWAITVLWNRSRCASDRLSLWSELVGRGRKVFGSFLADFGERVGNWLEELKCLELLEQGVNMCEYELDFLRALSKRDMGSGVAAISSELEMVW